MDGDNSRRPMLSLAESPAVHARAFPETYLSPEDLAKKLHISVGTLANWRSEAIGPAFVKVGRRKILYSLTDVEDYMLANRQCPAA